VATYKFGINEPPHKRWPVAWYNPIVLMRSAKEMVATADFIRNFDRRELFSTDLKVVDQSHGYSQKDFWWDFMSDSGDGGNASYTVARAMQSPHLEVGYAEGLSTDPQIGDLLPASRLLVLGGDLAYPGASTEEYQYRFTEMWEAAKPDERPSPLTVLSIPQNHDWFDNISSFSRHFVGDYQNHFLQAYTPQNRSYFVTRLPHGWWLLGLDFALVGDIDRTQYESILKLLASPQGNEEALIKPGDNIILLYPEPFWTRPLGDAAGEGYPKRYQRLEAKFIANDIKIRLRLAGDLHHYVRESATSGANLDYEDMLVTCGTGGAFLHPTHAKRIVTPKVLDRVNDQSAMTSDLEHRICVGLQKGKQADANQRQYYHQASYPGRTRSRFLSLWNLIALFKPASLFGLFADKVEGGLPGRCWQRLAELGSGLLKGNVMFPLLLGALYLLAVYCNSFVFSYAFTADGFVHASQIGKEPLYDFLCLWFKALFFSPLAFCVHLVLLILCGSIAHEDGWHAGIFGFFYGMIHVLTAAILFWLSSYYELNPYLKGLVIFAGGTFIGGVLFGFYFTLVSLFGGLANNGFSPIAHQGFKGFLRFRLDKDGNLHGYMIGTDAVPQRWIANPKSKRPLWIERKDQDAPEWKIRDAFILKK